MKVIRHDAPIRHDPALGRGPTLGAGSEYPQNTVVHHCSCEGPEQLPASVTCPYQIACPEGCRFAPGRELVDSSEVYVAHDKHHDRSLLFAPSNLATTLGSGHLQYDLTNADLRKANLEGAILEDVNLACAVFDGAQLKGAEFKNARGAAVSFRNAKMWMENAQVGETPVVHQPRLHRRAYQRFYINTKQL